MEKESIKLNKTLKEVFVKHSMCSIHSNDGDRSIFGIGDDGKMNLCFNHLKSAYVNELNEKPAPPIDLNEFVLDSKEAFEDSGIKNITGDYKIYMDDGNVLIIEGGKITFN